MVVKRICEIDYHKLISLDKLISTKDWQNDIPERKFVRFLRAFFDEVISRCRYISFMKTHYHLTTECLGKIEVFPGSCKTEGYILPDISDNITKLNNLFDDVVDRIDTYDARSIVSNITEQFQRSITHVMATGYVETNYDLVYDYINQIEDIVEYNGGYDDPGDELYLQMKETMIPTLEIFPSTIDGAADLLRAVFRSAVAHNEFVHHLISIYALDNNMGTLLETDLGIASVPLTDFAIRDIQYKLADIAIDANPDNEGLSCAFASKFLRFINSSVYSSSLLSSCDGDDFKNYNSWEEEAVHLFYEVLSFIENPNEHDSDTKVNEDTSDSESEGVVIYASRPVRTGTTPLMVCYTMIELILSLFDPGEDAPESDHPDDLFKESIKNGDKIYFALAVGDGSEHDAVFKCSCNPNEKSLIGCILSEIHDRGLHKDISRVVLRQMDGNPSTTHVAFAMTNISSDYLAKNMRARDIDIDKLFNDNFKDKGKDGKFVNNKK